MVDFTEFRLSDEFVATYAERPVPWGFPCGGGNSLGELTFLTKYSRVKEDGAKERWHETCRRVVEGVYSILKHHCQTQRTPWYHPKASRAAEDMYERMFTMKWTPPGRGIWMMGTPFVAEEGSAALQNCMFLSTEGLGPRNPTLPFIRLMEASMLGVGVGFDTLGADTLAIHKPTASTNLVGIHDSREGWYRSVDALLRSYFLPGQGDVHFLYDDIRPAGTPIKRFGGTAAGPGPLRELHQGIRRLFAHRENTRLTSTDIVDLMNLIGKCVVAGNVRRSAELALGLPDDKAFLTLKDPTINPDRMGANGWGWMSNNSVVAEVGGDYDHLINQIAVNGEPGLVYLDLMRSHGRLGDPANSRDYRAKGCNPCAEQTLEDNELCTLVETYPVHHETIDDYFKTLKCAYLYAKAVTLLPTHWPESNEVMTRNRRIGCSVSGLAQFVETRGWTELRTWMDMSYAEITRRDRQYSEWLGVRESLKKTSVKPSGTVSLLAGVTPGAHWPEEDTYIRRMRFRVGDPMVEVFEQAGYWVEPDQADSAHSVVVAFPTVGPQVRSTREVTVWEKVALAALMQRHWADNMVSATFTFQPHEKDQIGPLLHAFDGQLKTMSFLPMLDGGAYPQMPYEAMTRGAWEVATEGVRRIDYGPIYQNGAEPEGDRYCSNDVCEMPRPNEPKE